jgi:DNA modification methylase
MCGDATDEKHVETLMDGKKADMVFTDPPYGKEYDGRSDAHEQILNDDLSKKQITKFYKLGDANERYYCLDSERLPVLFEAQGMPKSLIVWDKGHFGMGDGYRRQYELIAYYGDYSGTTESDVWDISRDNTSEYAHPTQKPVELPARAIKNSSKQDDIVLDLFAGSGSTLLAAEQTDRKAFCMELDPQYCQVIINRWEELTGKNAEPVK